jgi:hypothetical protein
MRYVILRDDDTNALTPVDCLERLYRPFLDRGLPVNLATIPEVNVHTRMADGQPEGYLFNRQGAQAGKVAMGSNPKLVNYLRVNSGYRIVQHGCHHDQLEFDCADRSEMARRLERGAQALREAGFPKPETFVAPYDKLSRASLAEVAARFRVLSTGWFELRRLPRAWWPKFALKKLRQSAHWRIGQTWLLSHPGCLLSRHRPRRQILENIIRCLKTQPLTVLVTHWWEYFPDGQADESFIQALHETAEYLSNQRDVKTIAFDDLARGSFSFPFASVGRDSVEP